GRSARVLSRRSVRRDRPRARPGAAGRHDPRIRGRNAPAARSRRVGTPGGPCRRSGRARQGALLREKGRAGAREGSLMPLPRGSRARVVWALELALGLELYACAVLALHVRGLRATPLEASAALVLPALVIPPVFYVLVSLVSVRPLSLGAVSVAVAAMCVLHGLLVAATGALFMIPDLLDYGPAVAFALWGSPAVTLLQLTAAPLVFARLRPLLSSPRAPREAGARTDRADGPRSVRADRGSAPGRDVRSRTGGTEGHPASRRLAPRAAQAAHAASR